MHHFVTKMYTRVQISVTKWCIVGHWTLDGAFWDLCNRCVQTGQQNLARFCGTTRLNTHDTSHMHALLHNKIMFSTSSPGQMADILQTTFFIAFSWMKISAFWFRSHWSLFLGVRLTKTIITGSGNGFAPSWCQAISSTNFDRILGRHMILSRHWFR